MTTFVLIPGAGSDPWSIAGHEGVGPADLPMLSRPAELAQRLVDLLH